MQRINNILKLVPTSQNIVVNGWVRTRRESKDFTFVEINDGSCIKNLQIVADKNIPNYDDIIKRISTGSSIKAEGSLVSSPGNKQSVELQAKNIDIYGEAPRDEYPLQKKRHSFEFLREIAHLRPRTNTMGAVLRVRNALSYAIHTFFQERGFLYIHTPIITGSDCEGAGEMFKVTTLPLEKMPVNENGVDFTEDFFGKPTALTVSGQLEGEVMACALGNVYTFGPTFRAEHSNTTKHLAEFWMVEPEMAFCDIQCNMQVAEEFLKFIIDYILKNCEEDLVFFNKWIEPGVLDILTNITKSNFAKITYTEAINNLLASNKKFEFPVKWGIDMQSEHERYLTENVYNCPVIVIDYPKEIKAFYMKMNDDDKTVRAMDILFPRLGEIIGGSERENNYDQLLKRITDLHLNPKNYWWYLELRKYGTVPHSGFGLGFERLVQFVTGMKNIRDVIPFPRTFKSADF